MKKITIPTMMAVLILALGLTAGHAQPMGPGMMGPDYHYESPEGWNYCPYCGRYMGPQRGYGRGPGMRGRGYGMGPGMMGPGYGMGPGMMGPGYGRGPGMMGPQYDRPYGPGYPGSQDRQSQEPLDKENTKNLLENYLRSTGNPNLKLGEIEDKGNAFEAEIQTKDGSLVDKLLVDKRTGWMRSVY